jgi:uncharacterized protein GlcG (DUF336 family)
MSGEREGAVMPKLIETLTLAEAKAMVLAAEACASQLGIAYAIAVVDGGGHLLHFSRGEAGAPGCAVLAIDKAHTAAMFGHSTGSLARLAQPGAALYGLQHALGGRAVVFGGGLPVRPNATVIGAIGASAGTVDQDIAVAQAGVSALCAMRAPKGPAR